MRWPDVLPDCDELAWVAIILAILVVARWCP